jgi:hypothetical protein
LKRETIIGAIVVVLIIAGAYFLFTRYQASPEVSLPTETLPVSDELEEGFETGLGIEVPEGVEKAALKDVTGGAGTGLATRKFEEGVFEHTLMASLPTPQAGQFYEGWLVSDDDFILTGKLKEMKGGWYLEFEADQDYSDYNRVVVTLEEKDDRQPEKHVLEGSF